MRTNDLLKKLKDESGDGAQPKGGGYLWDAQEALRAYYAKLAKEFPGCAMAELMNIARDVQTIMTANSSATLDGAICMVKHERERQKQQQREMMHRGGGGRM